MKPLVYIAAPYTFPDPIANARVAAEAWHTLWESGLVTPICPHTTTILLHFNNPLFYEDWIAYDLELLARCDAILRLPGKSEGADQEVFAMLKADKPVFHFAEQVLLWAKGYRATPSRRVKLPLPPDPSPDTDLRA